MTSSKEAASRYPLFTPLSPRDWRKLRASSVSSLPRKLDKLLRRRHARVIDLYRCLDINLDGNVTRAELADALGRLGIVGFSEDEIEELHLSFVNRPRNADNGFCLRDLQLSLFSSRQAEKQKQQQKEEEEEQSREGDRWMKRMGNQKEGASALPLPNKKGEALQQPACVSNAVTNAVDILDSTGPSPLTPSPPHKSCSCGAFGGRCSSSPALLLAPTARPADSPAAKPAAAVAEAHAAEMHAANERIQRLEEALARSQSMQESMQQAARAAEQRVATAEEQRDQAAAALRASESARFEMRHEMEERLAACNELSERRSAEIRKLRRELLRMMVLRGQSDDEVERILREEGPALEAQVEALSVTLYGEDVDASKGKLAEIMVKQGRAVEKMASVVSRMQKEVHQRQSLWTQRSLSMTCGPQVV